MREIGMIRCAKGRRERNITSEMNSVLKNNLKK